MKAAFLERIGEPLRIVDLETPPGGVGQVLVKVLSTGICGSQLQEIDGIKGDPANLPHLLGHEGCGIVEMVGPGVTQVKRGDKVVLHWRRGAGMDVLGGVYGDVKSGPVTTFATHTIVSENRVTKIDHDVPNDLAALLGCCLSTALAIIENEAKPTKDESACIIGCGGVGLALILAARLRTNWVTAIDLNRSKREVVQSFGAAFTDVTAANIIIDTVGTIRPWYYCDRYISLQGGTSAGGFLPTVDIPRYVQMWRDGDLKDYPKLITHRIKLEQINEGIQLMRDGKAGRVMIEMA